jgi:cytochrome c biogenesis protein CcmG, thiol:disulfide interchange protein DsbE
VRIYNLRFTVYDLRVKYFYFLLFTFIFCFATACRPAAAPVSIANKPVSINDVQIEMPPTKPIEEMTLTKFNGSNNIDGDTIKLKDLQGKVVILDFWATYCPPCLEEIPHLKSLQAKYGKENLQVIGLHVGGEEDRPKVPAFVEKLKIDYILATPEDQLTRFIFGKQDAIPQTAIFDRKGKLVTKIIGFDGQIKKELDTAVEQTVNQK